MVAGALEVKNVHHKPQPTLSNAGSLTLDTDLLVVWGQTQLERASTVVGGANTCWLRKQRRKELGWGWVQSWMNQVPGGRNILSATRASIKFPIKGSYSADRVLLTPLPNHLPHPTWA